MLKIIAPFKFRTDKPYEECAKYWVEVHSQTVAACLPECKKYIQNLAVPVRSRAWPFDGVAEIWFEDMSAIRRSFQGELADRLREDELVFSPGGEASAWMITEERIIFER